MVLAQDVHGVAARPPQRGDYPPAPIERHEDQRRPQRDRREGVDGRAPGPLAIPGGGHRHPGREAAQDGPEGIGVEIGHALSLGSRRGEAGVAGRESLRETESGAAGTARLQT